MIPSPELAPEALLSDASLLTLLRLVSPALPLGAYAYSRGLEHAVQAGWVHDEASAREWIVGLATHSLAQLDAPIFARLYDALSHEDEPRVTHLRALSWASRESAELRLEDAHMGQALARLLVSLGVRSAERFTRCEDAGFGLLFALSAVHYGVPKRAALLGYLWTSCESQVSAAVRLVPLGQTAGQRITGALLAALPACASHALSLPDDQLGALCPALALGSALHETQYTRLFRS